MSTFWNGQICNDEGKYYIQFETDNKELYRLVEKACQTAMDINNNLEVKRNSLKGYYKPLLEVLEDGNVICSENKKLAEKEFVETYCHNCGSQRCEGIGTEWFDGCRHRYELKGYKGDR